MRILIGLYKYFFFGGLQRDTLFFAEEAVRRGHSVTILTTDWDGETPENIALDICRPGGWFNHTRMRNFGKEFRRRIFSGSFDVSVAMNRITGGDFYFIADTCQADALRRRKGTLSLMLNPRYRSFLQQEAELCASSCRMFAISKDQIQAYCGHYGMDESRFVLLPPGLDSGFVRPADAADVRVHKRAELGLNAGDIVLIQVASNIQGKGIDRTIEALSAMPENVRLLLAGELPEAEISALCGKYGTAGRVTCLGARRDVKELLLASDLMVHPAREEGAGTVLIEALEMGCPVICTEECGFAGYVSEATGTVVKMPFSNGKLTDLMMESLGRLDELRSRTLKYASENDFHSRYRVMVENLESFTKRK